MEDNHEIEEKKNIIAILLKFKKFIIIGLSVILFIILAIILRAIYLSNVPEFEEINTSTVGVEPEVGEPISTYFSFGKNALYDFKQSDGSSRNKTTFVTFFDEKRVQYAIYQPSVAEYWFNEIYELSDGEIRRVLYAPNSDININLLNGEFDQESTIILKEPLIVGNTWKIGSGDAEATITNVNFEVKTTQGLFKTIEVSIDYKNGNYRKDYFSQTSGLVKSTEINNDGTKSELLLSNIEPISTGLDRAMYVYYLNKDTFVGTQTLVNFKTPTNKETAEVFRELLSTSTDENLKPLISPYTKINSIKLDKNMRYIQVDFSKDFYAYTSTAKATETKHLAALANTFCRYYNVLNFKITVDGQPYTTTNYQFGVEDTIKATFK